MKFYVLKHPELGYFRSQKMWYSSMWTNELQYARKWNMKNHATTCRTQSGPKIKECEVVEIEVFGYSIMDSEKLVIIENRSKYADL